MLVLRGAAARDLDAIVELARGIGPGMTTLKADRGALQERLALAAASFAGAIAPVDADYLFVLEDLDKQRVCGVSGIKAAVGVAEPFYNYRISTSMHVSPATSLVHRVQSLHLTHDLSGTSELCSLYLHPDYRNGWNGRLLSKARFLFIAEFPALFTGKIFAEMRGVLDEEGRSPFWESVGRNFFRMDFQEADDLCGKGDRLFIEQLVPRLPLYAHLLGHDAQAAIGNTHRDTAPARRLLEQEGLQFDGYIDIFDGGPVLQAYQHNLRAVRESRLCTVTARPGPGELPLLVATRQLDEFRAIVTSAEVCRGELGIDPAALDALACRAGASLRILQPHPAAAAPLQASPHCPGFVYLA